MKNRSTETSLQDVQHILRVLHTYPKEMKLIGFEDLIQPEEVELTHKAWCDLYAKYDGNEKVHFSDTWFPLRYSVVDGEIHDNEIAICKVVADRLGFRYVIIDRMILDIVEFIAADIAAEDAISRLVRNL